MKSKFVVYTALFGDYDHLVEPKEKFKGCDFICFTDQPHLKSDIWEIKVVTNIDLPLNMMNRRYKLLPHLFLRDYEQSLYVDTNIYIMRNPIDLALKYLSINDFSVAKHTHRNCIYDEADECIKIGKTTFNETDTQMRGYKQKGFPENFGLGENNILLRNHNSLKIKLIMNEWWAEINLKTKRDQLCLGYVLWNNNEHFNFMNENSRAIDSKYFFAFMHLQDSYLAKIKNKVKFFFNKYLFNIKKI